MAGSDLDILLDIDQRMAFTGFAQHRSSLLPDSPSRDPGCVKRRLACVLFFSVPLLELP